MKKNLLILFKGLVALLAVLFIAITALTFFGVTVNLDSMRKGVEVAATSALNRDVSINGPVELAFSNWPALTVSDVSIANVEGGIEKNLLNVGFVRMQIGIFPLLRGEINIADISAERVTLNLESDVDGNPNWSGSKTGNKKASKTMKNGKEAKQIRFTALSHLSLQQIMVNYHDAALGKSLSFILESMKGAAPQGDAVELKLNGKVQGKSYSLEIDGSPIEDFFDKDKAWGFKSRGEVFGKQVAGKGSLLRRGEHPKVQLALGAKNIDVGVILAGLGLVEGMQASLGDVGIDVTVTGDSLQEVLNKSSMVFVVKDGNWKVTMPSTEENFNITHLHGKIGIKEGNNITMTLEGAIEEEPVKLFIVGAPLVEYVTNQKELPLSIKAEICESRLIFDSNVKLPISASDMTFALKVNSPRLDRLNKLLNLDLPSVGPVSLESKLDIKPQIYDLSAFNFTVGESSLKGSFKVSLSQSKPKLDISLVSKLLQLDDFRVMSQGRAEETGSGADKEEPAADDKEVAAGPDQNKGRNLLSYDVLNSFDADIIITANQVLAGEDKLGAAQLVLRNKDAALKAEPITLEIPGGRFDASLDYTSSPSDVAVNIWADIEDFDLGVLIRHLIPESDMGGWLSLNVKLDSTAPDLSSIMEHADGYLDFGLVPNNFSSGIIDLWAINLLAAVMDKSTEQDQSVVNCVVIRTKLEKGVLEEDAIYLDTSKMRIVGNMDIDFKTRDLAIQLAPKAKKPEFFNLAIPIKVEGSLDDFGLKIGALRMTGQVISFITSPVHVPIRRIFTENSPENGVQACRYAWKVAAEERPKDPEKD